MRRHCSSSEISIRGFEGAARVDVDEGGASGMDLGSLGLRWRTIPTVARCARQIKGVSTRYFLGRYSSLARGKENKVNAE